MTRLLTLTLGLLAALSLTAPAAGAAQTSFGSDVVNFPVIAGTGVFWSEAPPNAPLDDPLVHMFDSPDSPATKLSGIPTSDGFTVAGVAASKTALIAALADSEDCGGDNNTEGFIPCLYGSKFVAGPVAGPFSAISGCLPPHYDGTSSGVGYGQSPVAAAGNYVARVVDNKQACTSKARISIREIASGAEQRISQLAAKNVAGLAMAGDKLLIAGRLGNNRLGIWRFDRQRGALKFLRKFRLAGDESTFSIDLQPDGTAALAARLVRSGSPHRSLCRHLEAVVVIKPSGAVSCTAIDPATYEVKLKNNTLLAYDSSTDGDATLRALSLHGGSHVVRSTATPWTEPFDFDGSRIALIENGCENNTVTLSDLALNQHGSLPQTTCPASFVGDTINVDSHGTFTLTAACPAGCYDSLDIAGPRAIAKRWEGDVELWPAQNLHLGPSPATESATYTFDRGIWLFIKRRKIKRIKISLTSYFAPIDPGRSERTFSFRLQRN